MQGYDRMEGMIGRWNSISEKRYVWNNLQHILEKSQGFFQEYVLVVSGLNFFFLKWALLISGYTVYVAFYSQSINVFFFYAFLTVELSRGNARNRLIENCWKIHN